MIIGSIYAFIKNIYYSVRDFFAPPREEAVLFIAHPDDDVLFFHSYIKEFRPYVVLLTTGSVLRRILPFQRAMKYYGVRYRVFAFHSRALDKEKMISRKVGKILNKSHFSICATHNEEGEYGHEMHKCVHRCVVNNWKGGTLIVPYNGKDILEHPLDKYTLIEKQKVLFKYYSMEAPVLETHRIWITHEAFRKC